MQTLTVKIKADDKSLIPEYKSPLAAGVDLMASGDGEIASGAYTLVKTGISIELPPEVMRLRSDHAADSHSSRV